MSKFNTVDKLYDWYLQEECQKADEPEIQNVFLHFSKILLSFSDKRI